MKKNESPSKYEDRKGFWKIGYLENQDYPQRLKELTRKQIDIQDFDSIIDNLILEKKENYYDANFESTTENLAVYAFFPTNQKAFYRNKDIVAGFHRSNAGDRWKGVYLEQDIDILKNILANQRRRSSLEDYTYIYDYSHISKLCNQEFSDNNSTDEWANYLGDLFTKRSHAKEVFSFPMGSYFAAENLSEDGRKMYFWMERNDKPQAKQKGFGINLIDEKSLLETWSNFQHKYTLGRLVFSSWESLERFVAEVAQNAMPENWDRMYSNHETHYGYPVLKSYLEYTLIRLRYLSENENGYILKEHNNIYYNTGLLNKFFRQILVGAELKTITQSVPGLGNHTFDFYYDPYIIINGHDTKFPTEAGLLDLPSLANYFEKKEDVLYDASLEIMLNDEHIFVDGLAEGRIPMFRTEYENVKGNDEEMRNLHIRVQARIQIAIQRARLLAERNHKLAVPQFWKETGEVQFLLPLYMEETEYTGRPQCALALRRSKNGRYYEGATILSLDMAYSNARLIAKPDVTWLNRGFKENGNDKSFSDLPMVEKEIVPFSPVIDEKKNIDLLSAVVKKAPKKEAPVREAKKRLPQESLSEDKIGHVGILSNIASRPSGKGLKGTILGATGTVARSLLKHPVPRYTKSDLKVKIIGINPQGNQYVLEPVE